MWYEKTNKILFSSDFCCQEGTPPALTQHDISESIINFYTNGGFIPYGKTTNLALEKISALGFETLAPVNGEEPKSL